MQSVPAPPLVVRAPSRGRRRSVALAALLAALAAVGALQLASTDRHGSAARARPTARATASALIGGVQLQQARCAQWQAGSEAERRRTVGALAAVVGGPTGYGPGTTLSTEQAYALFTRDCSSPIAQSFLLYELYIRAAAFRSVSPGG